MFPRVKVDVIEQAGHWVHAEQQAAFLDCMRRALLDGPETTPRSDAAAS